MFLSEIIVTTAVMLLTRVTRDKENLTATRALEIHYIGAAIFTFYWVRSYFVAIRPMSWNISHFISNDSLTTAGKRFPNCFFEIHPAALPTSCFSPLYPAPELLVLSGRMAFHPNALIIGQSPQLRIYEKNFYRLKPPLFALLLLLYAGVYLAADEKCPTFIVSAICEPI